jgi:hypothetical protein
MTLKEFEDKYKTSEGDCTYTILGKIPYKGVI